eukprot:4968128-Ditylum_brightwellii.AAC.1
MPMRAGRVPYSSNAASGGWDCAGCLLRMTLLIGFPVFELISVGWRSPSLSLLVNQRTAWRNLP